MTDERAIVRASSPTPDPRRSGVTHGDSPWREDAFAVVIGINEYVDPKIPNLRFARADAEALYQLLTDPAVGRFKPDNVTLLVDGQATERNVRSAIGTQLPRRAGKDSTVLIYYAGHGAPVIDPRAKSVDGLEKYLVPADAVADDLRASAIAMESVQQYFSWLDASQVICFLDRCYSGTAGGRSFDRPGFQTRAMLSDEFLDSLASEGRFVVTACATNEVSLESPQWRHGIFTHYLIEGLKGAADADGNGKVTIDELYEYIYANVERDARSLGGSMNPVKKGSVRGTIYLTEYETPDAKRAREALQLASAAAAPGDGAESRGVAGVKRQQRVLLGYMERGELTMSDYNRALTLLDADPTTLHGVDAQYRRLVDGLVAGDLTIRSFVRSHELLDAATAEHPQVTAAAPPLPARVSPPPVQKMVPPALQPARTRNRIYIGGAILVAGVAAIVFWPRPSPPPDSSRPTPSTADSSNKPPFNPATAAASQNQPLARASVDTAPKLSSVQAVKPRSAPAPPPAPPASTHAQTASRAAAEVHQEGFRTPSATPLPLTRVQFFPPPGATNVPTNSGVTLRFFELSPTDHIALGSLLNRVSLTSRGVDVPFHIETRGGDILLVPQSPLADGMMQYTVLVSVGITTEAGRQLTRSASSMFTTVPSVATANSLPPGAGPVASIVVRPSSTIASAGQQVQFAAPLMYASGAPLLGRAMNWVTDNNAVVMIDGRGLAQAVAPGTTTIYANSEGQKSNLVVFTVKP